MISNDSPSSHGYHHSGLERKDEGKLVFVWSQSIVCDELKKRKRAVGLMFFDFVEALTRLADLGNVPSIEEQLKLKLQEDEFVWKEGRRVRVEKPLHVKFGALLHLLERCHMAEWGGKDGGECAAKMMQMASVLGSDIELA